MAGLKHWLVRHDKTGRQIIVKGKRRALVERRYPAKDYTVLSAMRTHKHQGKGG